MFALIVLGIVVLALSLATAVMTVRDGYSRIPTNPDLLWDDSFESPRALLSVR